MSLIRFLFQTSWQLLTIATATGLISGLSSAGLIALINIILRQWGTPASSVLVLSFISLSAIALTAGIASQLLLIRLAQQAIYNLRLQLGRSILSADLAHLEQTGPAKLLATLTDDIQALANAVWIIPFLCIDLAMVIGGLSYILVLAWQVLLFVVALILLFLGFYNKILRRAKHQLRLGRDQQDHLFQHFRALTNGTKELKLHHDRRQAFLTEEYAPTAAQFRHHQTRGLSWFALIDNFGKFAFFFAFGTLLFLLPTFLQIPTATLTGYLLTFLFIRQPLENLIARMPTLSQASIALDKIAALNLSLTDRAETHSPPEPRPTHWQTLQLQHVHHTYPGEGDTRFTLGPISLDFHPGELIFLIGGNGSGKSTLAKIITGLYPPENGEILLDQQPITDQTRESYRQHFSVIFAEFHLFDRLLGLTAPPDKLQHYLQILKLDHKVRLQGDRLTTTDLSTGQRKRLALLTAILEDRPIYLFDEWAADQDPTFRQYFYTEFLPHLQRQGKTIIAITHDDHYFHLADRVIKLEYGQLEYDRPHIA